MSDLPRLVRVPLAGYIDVEIDPTIEVETSHGWNEATPFEQAAVDAAQTALMAWLDKIETNPSKNEWQIDTLAKIVSGNVLHVDCNEVEDLGTE